MSDESRIKDVIVELDKSCAYCYYPANDFYSKHFLTYACGKHLLMVYEEIRSMPQLYDVTFPKLVEELKRRKLL